jgi:hypothetical protein
VRLRKLITMREALESPAYFGTLLAGDSWAAWRVLLIAIVGRHRTRVRRTPCGAASSPSSTRACPQAERRSERDGLRRRRPAPIRTTLSTGPRSRPSSIAKPVSRRRRAVLAEIPTWSCGAASFQSQARGREPFLAARSSGEQVSVGSFQGPARHLFFSFERF